MSTSHGFKSGQQRSHLELVNEFKECMEDALEEAKAALAKSKDDMTKYYNQRWTPTPGYKPGDKVYLDASNIQTNRPSRKLSHCRLGPFPIVKKVSNGAYQLWPPPSMSRLHPVFNVVKPTPALVNPIKGHCLCPPLLLEIIDREEEWVIEEVLDSKIVTFLPYFTFTSPFLHHNYLISLLQVHMVVHAPPLWLIYILIYDSFIPYLWLNYYY